MNKLLVAIAGLGILSSLVMMILKRIWSKEAEDKETIENTDMDDPSSITSTFDKINRCIIIGALLFISGCSKVILHPIYHTDIIRVQKGEKLDAPKNGYFLSDDYVKEVMQAKVVK